jgi:hypothetical protein
VDGNKLKANLSGLTGAVGKGNGLAGADAQGNVQLYAPTTLAQGSSFSHYDTRLTPNAIMEYAINQDLMGQIDVDLTPALFQDIGWGLNRTSQKLLTCDTGIPTVVPGGVIVGANVISNAKIIAGDAATLATYRTGVLAYASSLAASGLITSAQASSLNACFSDAETEKQYAAWHAAAPDAAVLSNNVGQTNQSGAAGSSKAYSLDVPAGAKTLTFRTAGGSGDVSIAVRAPGATTYAPVTNRPGNAEVYTKASPASGTWTFQVTGVKAYSGVIVQAVYTK